jgi:hypothetical protein
MKKVCGQNKASVPLSHLKTLALTRIWISRIEDVSLNFKDNFYDWKGKGNKYNMQWRNDENNYMSVKAEATLELPIMHLIAILYEDDFYVDWVRF